MFKGKYHWGYVCDFDDKEGYYEARYEDGDIEEYDKEQMKSIRHRPNNWQIQAAMAETRFERVQAVYDKTESAYNPPYKFTGGYAHAIEVIEMGPFEMAYQGYKYANVVIDEKTGKVMEYRGLLKDEQYRDTWSRAGSNKYGQLFQGCGRNADGTQQIEGTNACHWIPRAKVPRGKKVTYVETVVDI